MHSSGFRIGLGLSLALLASHSAQALSPVPTNKPSAFPDWWFERDLILRLNPANQTPDYSVAGTYLTADDFAAANIGQLKNIATKAADELKARIPSGEGAAIHSLVTLWLSPTTPDDFASVNQGQLKAVASLYYQRL